ncbi:MAG TPA: DUF58 domain-containing protein [Microbacteriaceae bacterium]
MSAQSFAIRTATALSPLAVRAQPITSRLSLSAAALWAVLRSPIERTLGIITSFGWVLVCTAAVAALVAAAAGWRELTVVAIACASVVLVAVAFTLGRSAYGVQLDLAGNRVVVGSPASGHVMVRNTATKALLPARIELPVGASHAVFHLPRMARGAEHEELFTIPTSRRAVLTVGPVRSVRGDALGILRRVVRWTDPVDLFVHPRTISLDGTSAGFLRDLEGSATRELSMSDISFHALREYIPGDDRRYVHWKSSARAGKLMVRQFEETRRSHLAIALSSLMADYGDDEAFELAISACGSLGLQAVREEKEFSVLVSGSNLHPATGPRFLDELSGLNRGERHESVIALGQRIGQTLPHTSVAVFVCGRGTTPAQLRTAAAQLPIGVRAIAIQCIPGAEVSRRAIGDLAILTIGALKDLPRAMRRAAA